MQNMPIINKLPIASAQAPAQTESHSSAQAATEPFGNVLARQRANADANANANANAAHASKQAASSAANDTNNANHNQPAQTSGTDAGTPPADMLATLLPATTTNNPPLSSKDKTAPQAPVMDGAATLPGDMLGMMLPAPSVPAPPPATTATTPTATTATVAADAATGQAIANEKSLQGVVTDGNKKARPQPAAATALDGMPQPVADKKAVPKSATLPATPLEVVAGANTGKDNSFSAALGAVGKDGAKGLNLAADATKIAARPVAPAAPDGLMQSGMATVTHQNVTAQVTQAVINTPVTDRAWGNEFNQKITWMATQREQSAELHLNPPNLGPLDVVLKVSGDQATALFTSPHAAVRDAVEQALPHLREMMADKGITLGNAMVSDQSPKDQQAWQANQQQNRNGGTAGSVDTSVAAGVLPSGTAASPGRRHLGMVDTFA